MTRSTGWSGLIRFGAPPSLTIASRMAARSTTAGTPVKSWSSTRLVRNAISCSAWPRTFHRASASMSDRLTNASSSLRSRFSRRMRNVTGSRSTVALGILASAPRREIVYDAPSTRSVDRASKELREAMSRNLEPMMNAGSGRTVLDAASLRGQTRVVHKSRLAVLARVGVVTCAVVACVQTPVPSAPATSQVIYSHDATTWFEEYFARATSVSPDGRRLVFSSRGAVALIDVQHGALPMEAWAGVEEVTGVVIRPSGEVAVRGRRGNAAGWYERDRAGRLLSIDISPTATPQWSEDGESIAYQEATGPQWMLHLVARSGRRVVPMPMRAQALGWYPDAAALLVMLPDSAGLSSLHRLNARTGEMRLVASALDAEPRATTIAVAPDGRRAYVALASAGRPIPEERHDPRADRDLDVYELDLATGARRMVASTIGDDTNPLLTGGSLYWTSTRVEASAVALPIEGGAHHTVVADAQAPTWHPNGRQIGYFFGDWHAADWALNWDR